MNYEIQQTFLPYGQFRFQPVRNLGSGGFGIVDEILVTESNSSLPVGARLARKRLNAQFGAHPEAQERFEREIEQVRAMVHLDGVVNFQGENLPGVERFYVMDVFPKSLRSFIDSHGRSPWRVVAGFASTIASTMAEAHAMGFIHRDLKPENILLTTNNHHVVADWGLGYFLHQHSKVLAPLTIGGVGTAYYCSMEQWATGKCDERGDIYSLGMLTAELACGYQPSIAYQGAGLAADVVATPDGAHFNMLLRELTSMIVDGRPSSMREVASRLSQAASS